MALLSVHGDRPHAPQYQRTLSALQHGALTAVHALGWRPRVLASGDHPVALSQEIARQADLVVLLGGEDVDPRLYSGALAYPEGGSHSLRADRGQIAAVLEAYRSGKPLLGICRGHQLINVAFGGTLVQHLPNAHLHRGASAHAPFRRVRPNAATPSDLGLERGERVLCTHHQAIGRLGHGLEAAAHAPDGTIEAIVHRDAPITGVQWHPEHPSLAHTQLRRLLIRMAGQRGHSSR